MNSGNAGRNSAAKKRHDFSQKTKELIAKKAGYICSFPKCSQLTTGPSDDRMSGASQIGVAAHITAASVGGPRYDPALTPEERSSEKNGVWLCQNHGKLIDDNQRKFSVDDIKRWKYQHEEWIFAHLCNVGSELKDGISRVSIKGVGIFEERVDIKLGRYNVVYGKNSAGATTLCQAIAAFSGRANYNLFADRFKFCRGSEGDAMVEAVVSHDNKATTVKLSQQKLLVRRASHLPPAQRIRVEIDGNIAPSWPQSLFKVINLNENIFDALMNSDRSLPHAISALSGQLNLDEQIIWDMLHEEIFMTSPFSFKIKRTGIKTVIFRVPDGRNIYLPFRLLSNSEQALAITDILFKILRTDNRTPPWLVVFDSDFTRIFNNSSPDQVFTRITANSDLQFQAIFIVPREKVGDSIRAKVTDNWIGSDVVGGLTIHRFL